jgi:hypothetical protein
MTPFAGAARMAEETGGVRPTVERAAEASDAAVKRRADRKG